MKFLTHRISGLLARSFAAVILVAVVSVAITETVIAQDDADATSPSTGQAAESGESNAVPDEQELTATVPPAVSEESSVKNSETSDDEAADEKGETGKKPKQVDFSAIEEQYKGLIKASDALKDQHPDKAAELEDQEIWISMRDKVVMVGATVCLNRGQLEMFACTRGTKEHESIVVINSSAYLIHTFLLAIGAEEGDPVSYEPEYKPASGSEIIVEVHWFDESGMPQKVAAQEWIKNSRTDKQMKHPWVFAGSDTVYIKESGVSQYLAEGGEVICVSNFTTALLDLPVKSSDLNDGLLFSAFHERIPPLGTPVRLTLRLKDAESGADDKPAGEDKAAVEADASDDADKSEDTNNTANEERTKQ